MILSNEAMLALLVFAPLALLYAALKARRGVRRLTARSNDVVANDGQDDALYDRKKVDEVLVMSLLPTLAVVYVALVLTV